MLLRALVESSERFSDVMPPIGYQEASIKWVVDIDPSSGRVETLGPYDRGTLEKRVPTRGDRSGTVSEDNEKPALFVDRASYVFGLREKGEIATGAPEHKGFLKLLKAACLATAEPEAAVILDFLRDQWALDAPASKSEGIARLRDRVRGEMKPKDLVALRAGGQVFPFETLSARSFWADHLERVCCRGTGSCAICGAEGPLMRILPWQVGFFGYSCPMSSFNRAAFYSFGKKQTGNSPICFRCASKASQLLQYLAQNPRHLAVLS